MTAAAFQATYSDWRLIKGRKQVQIVFEVPLEQASAVHDVLGGMPDPSKSVWCAIARLNSEKEALASQETPATTPRADADNATRGAKKLTQRIAILCQDPVFQQFLAEEYEIEKSENTAADFVRDKCRVASRKDIAGTDAQVQWQNLYTEFQAWNYGPNCGAD